MCDLRLQFNMVYGDHHGDELLKIPREVLKNLQELVSKNKPVKEFRSYFRRPIYKIVREHGIKLKHFTSSSGLLVGNFEKIQYLFWRDNFAEALKSP